MAEGILPPTEVALRRVAEEVRRLANGVFTLSLVLLRPALHFPRGDGLGSHPPGGRQPSYAHYRGVAVGEVAEEAPRLALGLRPPGKALSH